MGNVVDAVEDRIQKPTLTAIHLWRQENTLGKKILKDTSFIFKTPESCLSPACEWKFILRILRMKTLVLRLAQQDGLKEEENQIKKKKKCMKVLLAFCSNKQTEE